MSFEHPETQSTKEQHLQEQLARMIHNQPGQDDVTLHQIIHCSLGLKDEDTRELRSKYYPGWTNEDFSKLLDRLSATNDAWALHVANVKKLYKIEDADDADSAQMTWTV